MRIGEEDFVTVRELVNKFNPDDVLAGRILFKVIKHGTKSGKWIFYNEPKEASSAKTMDAFCERSDVSECMGLVVSEDGYSVECVPYHRDGEFMMAIIINVVDFAEVK